MAQLTFDGDDELWDNGEDLGVTTLEEVEDSLDSEESVRVLLLANSLHEDGQVVMIVKLGDFDFPGNFVGLTMLNLNWQISTIVETTELTGGNSSATSGAGSRSNHLWLLSSFI